MTLHKNESITGVTINIDIYIYILHEMFIGNKESYHFNKKIDTLMLRCGIKKAITQI